MMIIAGRISRILVFLILLVALWLAASPLVPAVPGQAPSGSTTNLADPSGHGCC
jgi:hypothetical protein